MDGLGVGLAALGFWLMITAAVVVGMWFPARIVRDKQQAELEAARLAIEAGQPADQALKNVLRPEMAPSRKLRIGGIVVLGAGAGVAICGWFVGVGAPAWAMPMYGAGALTACVGLSLLAAGVFVGSGDKDDR